MYKVRGLQSSNFFNKVIMELYFAEILNLLDGGTFSVDAGGIGIIYDGHYKINSNGIEEVFESKKDWLEKVKDILECTQVEYQNDKNQFKICPEQ